MERRVSIDAEIQGHAEIATRVHANWSPQNYAAYYLVKAIQLLSSAYNIQKMKVLVLGAAGNLGRHVVSALAKTSSELTVVVRSKDKLLQCLQQINAESCAAKLNIVEGSITDATKLQSVMAENNVCIMTAGRPDSNEPESSLGALLPAVLQAAQSLQQPKRFICLGGMGITEIAGTGMVYKIPMFPAVPAGYSAVHEANYGKLQALPTGSMEWTMITPGFMQDEADKPIAATLDAAPLFDASGALAVLPAGVAFPAVAPLMGRSKVPYAAVAQMIADMATADKPETAILGKPWSAYLGKRVGVYLA